jgi:phenylacetate-CoA ligase
MHVPIENLVVEIVVTENGVERPAREGETGEVVLTDLHNFAMPFIRYANGDIATAGSTERCTCGRTLPRIESVQGRLSETLRDGQGSAVSGVAISYLFFDVSSEIRQFQAIQHKDHSVSINVVPIRALDEAQVETIKKNGMQLLRGVPVQVNVVPDLPRSPAGKHRLVIVER